jgi:2-polyprenyl-3-methyl-5-hydroxy-6-metoxy-1,4-benzoquinol methylase
MMIKVTKRDILDLVKKRFSFIQEHIDDFVRIGYPSVKNLQPEIETNMRLKQLNILLPYLIRGNHVLDIGISLGVWPFLLTHLGMRCTGFEYGKICDQSLLTKLHPEIDARSVAYDYEKWPLEDESVDIITMLDVIEHIHPPLAWFMYEACRVLKKGGIILIGTPNQASLRKRLWLLFGCSVYPPLDEFIGSPFSFFRGHIREYTMGELSKLVSHFGLRVVKKRFENLLIFEKLATSGKLVRATIQLYRIFAKLMPPVRDSLLLIAKKP